MPPGTAGRCSTRIGLSPARGSTRSRDVAPRRSPATATRSVPTASSGSRSRRRQRPSTWRRSWRHRSWARRTSARPIDIRCGDTRAPGRSPVPRATGGGERDQSPAHFEEAGHDDVHDGPDGQPAAAIAADRVRVHPFRGHGWRVAGDREVGDGPGAARPHLLLLRRRVRPPGGPEPRGSARVLPASRDRRAQRPRLPGRDGGHGGTSESPDGQGRVSRHRRLRGRRP